MLDQSLLYYNRDEDSVPLELVIRTVCKNSGLALRELGEIRDWPDNCQIGIIHGNPTVQRDGRKVVVDYYEYLSGEDIQSTEGLVVVFVSSGSMNRPAKRIVFRSGDGREGFRYLLPIRHAKECGMLAEPGTSGRPDWEKVVQRWGELIRVVLDKSLLGAWFDAVGKQSSFGILDRLFRDQPRREKLIALAILCQGYLAVHAARVPTIQSRAPVVEHALNQMGWSKRVSCDLVGDGFDVVYTADWWSSPFGSSKSEVERAIAKESGLDNISEARDLSKLIDAIYRGGDTRITEDIVANAYCAIAMTLGGRPCGQT
jgi:hypothetical protein